MTIAALYVDKRGCYAGLPDVEFWDEERDARLYAGPHPVVAHPPCSCWCRLAGLVEARWGHKKGDDGGCFAAALEAVRRWGGVLEHPAYSDAWAAHDLNKPTTGGCWVNADMVGGWTCYVEQGWYGHPARKATWLYACKAELPTLQWGADTGGYSAVCKHSEDRDLRQGALVSWCGNHTSAFDGRRRLSSKDASATPHEFRDLLLSMAKAVEGSR